MSSTVLLPRPRPARPGRAAALPSWSPSGEAPLPWVRRAADAPYFELDTGEPWTPIGQNDAITWPELAGLFRGRDLPGVEAELRRMRAHGVTVLRLMLEYCHREHRYFERPAGRVVPAMVRLWDDLFTLCERVGMRILLTPFDTFFTWIRWRKHPYARANGGPCPDRGRLAVCADTRALIKARLAFAAERWGGSGALFAWDLWNELHPAHGGGDAAALADFVGDLSAHVRAVELREHGRAHPQTVSVFGPELERSPGLAEIIFRHPTLDFASSHLYATGTIDDPRDTVVPALDVARLVRTALGEIADGRPFLDSEHGPIHAFKDRHRILPAAFDDEYFRHIQWAHLAAGGAGGGMRWPNRHPHVLTPGMRRAQRALAAFLPLVDWGRFRRRPLADDVLAAVDDAPVAPGAAARAPVRVVACGDARQVVAWLVRTDTRAADGRVRADAAPRQVRLALPALDAGRYRLTAWDTAAGREREVREVAHAGGLLDVPVAVASDLALAARRLD